MRRREPSLLVFLLSVLLLGSVGLVSPGAGAQDDPTPTASDEAEPEPLREVLLQAVLDELPATPAFIRLVRITLEPGARVPMHVHPGPEFARVEAGTLTVRVDGEAVVAPPTTGETPQPPRVPPVGEEFTIGPGSQIVYPADVPFTFSNQSQESVSILTILIVPAGSQRPATSEWVGGTPIPEDLAGVTSLILGDAVAPGWPEGNLAIVLDRLVLGPGVDVPARFGPVMLAVELGRFGFSLVEGQFQVSRGSSGPNPDATPGASYALRPGDAVFFPAGINAVPREEGEGVLAVLRLSVLPTEGTVGTPAAGEADADNTPAPDSEAGANETTVEVTGPGVRLRSGPSTESEVVAELDEGRALIITGALVEGDGINWYPVAAADDPAVTGYIAEEFVTPAS